MKDFFKTIIFLGVVAFMLHGCKVTKHSFPDRPGKTVRVTTVEELQQAILDVGTNETVLIADGIYHLKRPLLIENKIHFTLRGASADAAKVVLHGGGWEGGDRDSDDVLVIRSSDDITIADLTITEARSYGIKVEAIAYEPHPSNIHILRCHFLNIGTRAIKGTGPKDHKPLVGGSVRFCRFENTKVPDRSWLYNGDYISAIDMMYLKDWVFSDNVFKNIRGANGGARGAIFIWNQSRNIVVERNVFVGCDRSISFGNPSEPTNYEPGTLHNYDGIIRNNFIVSDIERGMGIEVVWADNVQVCHNTVYTPNPQQGAIHYFQKISRLFIANNLVRGRIFGEGEAGLEGNVTGDLDSYFINPAVGDLHLTVRAVEALGKGIQLIGVRDDIDGQKRKKHTDLGADQWVRSYAQPESYNLRTWPKGSSPIEIGTRIAEKFLETPHSQYGITHPVNPPTQITYPDVCTWLGGLWFANVTKNDDLYNRFESRFAPLFDTEKNLQPKPNHVDNNVFGSVPLELYLKTKQQKYLDLGLLYADTQWTLSDGAKPEEKAWADQGYTWQTRIWIDDMFMITAIQSQAYRATGDRKYIDRAAKEMVLYLDKIQLENGLFYHSPEAHYSWSRGNGWMAVGMAEILRILPKDNPNRERIVAGYKKMMAALLKFQESDGMWRQIIDDPEAWKETSGTAMFTYSMITGVKNGWLDKKTYGAAARKGWLALISHLNQNDEMTEVCEGTNIKNDRNHYLQRKRIVGDLHGQAPVLWCATALLR